MVLWLILLLDNRKVPDSNPGTFCIEFSSLHLIPVPLWLILIYFNKTIYFWHVNLKVSFFSFAPHEIYFWTRAVLFPGIQKYSLNRKDKKVQKCTSFEGTVTYRSVKTVSHWLNLNLKVSLKGMTKGEISGCGDRGSSRRQNLMWTGDPLKEVKKEFFLSPER